MNFHNPVSILMVILTGLMLLLSIPSNGQTLNLDGERLISEKPYTTHWTAGPNVSDVSLSCRIKDSIYYLGSAPAGADSLVWLCPFIPDSIVSAKLFIEEAGVPNGLKDSSEEFYIIQARTDIYEPNNSFATAYSFTLGDTLDRGYFSSANDTDVFCFNAGKGDLVWLKLINIPGLNWGYNYEVKVCDFNGKELLSTGAKANLKIRASYTGMYYIKTRPKFGGITRYTLYSGILEHAGTLSLVLPIANERLISESKYTLRWTGGDTGSTVDLSYRIKGATYPIGCCIASVDSFQWSIPLVQDSVGDVKVFIKETVIANGLQDSSSIFSIVQTKPDIYEPNNRLANAYVFTLGDTLDGGIILVNDTDVFTFTAEQRDLVSLKVPVQAWSLLDSLGRTVSSNIMGYMEYFFRPPYSGKYYVMITSSNFPKYSLFSKKMLAPFSVQTIVPSANERVISEEKYTIRWSVTGDAPKVSLTCRIKDTVYSIGKCEAGADSFVWSIPFIPDSIANAKIFIQESGVTNGLKDSSQGFYIVQTRPDIYEPNNTLATAHLFTLGDTLNRGYLSSTNDTDVYCFNAVKGNLIAIQWSWPDAVRYHVSVCDSSGKEIFSRLSGSNLFLQKLRATYTGKYYIKIYDGVFASNPRMTRYTLFADIFENTGTFSFNCPIANERLISEIKYTIRWTAGNRISPDLSYRMKGATYSIETFSAVDSFHWSIPLVQDSVGDIKVFIRETEVINGLQDSSAGFSIVQAKPDIYEPNNRLANGYVFTLGDTLDRGIISPNDTDVFTFTAEKEDLILIDLEYHNVNMRLFDSSGNLIVLNNNNFRASYSGTYNIIITFSGYTTRYRIFSNKLLATISVPVLVSPTSGAENISVNTTLSWSIVPYAQKYQVQISSNGYFLDRNMVTDTSGITTTSVIIDGLQSSTVYYWRVRAMNAEAASDWSDSRWFTTIPGSMVETVFVPSATFVGDNYPSPFNPNTFIQYGLAEKGHASIAIYDIHGKLVRNLVDEFKTAGFYSIEWNGKDMKGVGLSTGYYICKSVLGKYKKINKMLLIR